MQRGDLRYLIPLDISMVLLFQQAGEHDFRLGDITGADGFWFDPKKYDNNAVIVLDVRHAGRSDKVLIMHSSGVTGWTWGSNLSTRPT